MYDILRDEYDIQIEFGDIGNILAYLSMGGFSLAYRMCSSISAVTRSPGASRGMPGG